MNSMRCFKLWLPPVVAALIVAVGAPATAHSSGQHGSAGHGMGPGMHVMSGSHGGRSMGTDGHAAHSTHLSHAMPADGHMYLHPAEDRKGTAQGHTDEHGPLAGHDSGHGQAAGSGDRPVALVLTGFGGFNLLVVLAAVILRRRPAAIKRRETLARVRLAAGGRKAESTPGARP